MKNLIINVLSELFLFGLGLGIIFLLYPGIPTMTALYIALVIYAISIIGTFVIEKIIKWCVDKYYDWKDSKDE